MDWPNLGHATNPPTGQTDPRQKSRVEIMSGPIIKEHAFVVIAKNPQIIEKIIGVRSPYKYPAQSNMLLQKFTNPSLVNGKQKLHEVLQIFLKLFS